jgi:hypothetical protein
VSLNTRDFELMVGFRVPLSARTTAMAKMINFVANATKTEGFADN